MKKFQLLLISRGIVMKRITSNKAITTVILGVFCLFFTFIGCSGGSSGGGDGGGTDTGTTAAEISEDNAADLATGALAMGQSANIVSISGASQDNQDAIDSPGDHSRALRFPLTLADAARSIDFSPPVHQSSVEANYTETDTIPGPCGGVINYTITINDLSGEFTGTFSFLDYCEDGVTINGETEVAGTANVATGDIITITFWFDDLSDGTMAMDGKITMDFSDSPILCTLSAYCRDVIRGKEYQAKNYSLNIWEYPDRNEVEIFGTFYHPDYGSVTVSTKEIFVIYDGDEWPSSGILLVFGANNTSAMLTAIDNISYSVEADTDGDGVYDFESGTLYWSEYPPFRGFIMTGSYLQFRTYSDAARNKYRGWVDFLNFGQPIDESDIAQIVLKDPDQNEVVIDQITFDPGDYYFGYWDSGTQQVVYNGPWAYTGFSIQFPEGATFSSGNYTYEATTHQGITLSDVRYFPGELILPVVDSSTMTSEWIDGDLKLSWTIPFPGGQHDQVRVWLYNEQNNPDVPLMIRLPNTATEVTIPAEVINNVKQLSNNAQAMDWLVLLYAIENTTNNSYARSFSDSKPIAGWSVQAQPQILASGLNAPADIQLDAASVYWVEIYSDAVKKVPINGGTTTIVASSNIGGNNGSLAIDATHIYWADSSTIWKTELVGGPVTVLASGLNNISYLRVYSIDLYFRSNSGIEKVDLETGTVTTLVPAESPIDFYGGLAVDATGIYFPDHWKGTIFKSSLDGKQITTLAAGLNEPQSLLLDSGFLFWAEKESIRQMSSTGGTITTIVSDISPNQIAKDDTHIYWTDYYGGTIYKADLDSGAVVLLAAAQVEPSSLTVDANSVYWICSGNQYYPPLGSVKKVPHSFY
jgi:hypothetical protein